MQLNVRRYHDISCGHRVVGHEGKCKHLHGHNYRVHFTCTAEALDDVGRVIDFSVIKAKLCMWLEDNWDHRFLMWDQDHALWPIKNTPRDHPEVDEALDGIVIIPFNPTAELMAQYLLDVIGPRQLAGTGVRLVSVTIDETRKCSAEAVL